MGTLALRWLLQGPSNIALESRLVVVGSKPGCDLHRNGLPPLAVHLLVLPHKVVVEAQAKGAFLGELPLKPGLPQDFLEGQTLVLQDQSSWVLGRQAPTADVHAVLDAVDLLLESSEPAQSLPRLLEFAARFLAADGGVLLVGTNSDQVETTYPLSTETRFSKTAVRTCLEKNTAILWAESGNTDAPLEGPSLVQSGIRSVLCAPLIVPGNPLPLGVLYLHRTSSAAGFRESDRLHFQRLVETLARIQSANLRHKEDRAALEAMRSMSHGTGILAFSDSMQKVLTQAKRYAPASVPVLVRGETGTGKERLAQLLHEQSPRAQNPFIAVNCAAIPSSLMEAELFGYDKGAFTGASSDRQGLFEAANGGTLFLDEIGELALHLQAALLRALQEKRIRRVGSTSERPVDVRIVAATHRDLESLVQEGKFRQDLFFRLNVATLRLPALRDRPDDILPLARLFAQRASLEFGIAYGGLSRAAEKALLRYAWPGNVRELENSLQRALLESAGTKLQPEHLGLELAEGMIGSLADVREAAERNAVELAMARSGGNLTQAGAILGIDRKVLRDLLKRLGLRELSKEEMEVQDPGQE